MVKSAAASRLGDMLKAMASKDLSGKALEDYMSDENKHGCNLSKLYMDLLKDDHDYVKVAAVRSSPAVFKYWSLDSEPGKRFAECAVDKSWRVRVAVAEVLGEVALGNPAQDNVLVAREICKQLMSDPEAEVIPPFQPRCFSRTLHVPLLLLSFGDAPIHRISTFSPGKACHG